MSAMISLNSLKNDNKSEISQNVNINVNNNDNTTKDIKVSYNDNDKPITKIEDMQIFDYHNNILPNIKNEYYNNLCKVFACYIDILNEGRYKKKNGQNVLFIKDYLRIIELLSKTYITNNQDCNIKICVDEHVGCFVNDTVIDSITCTYKCNYVDVFINSPEIVNILQMMKIDKQRIINEN